MLRTFARAAVFVAGCLFAGAPQASAVLHDVPFCESPKVARNFLRPLERLPNRGDLRESGKLDFGPKVLRILPPRSQLVIMGHTRFGLTGSLATTVGGTPLSLGWWVDSRLDQINRSGKVLVGVKGKHQFVASIQGFARRDFGFGGSVKPDVYRVAVAIRDKRHSLVGRIYEFFRVVKPQSGLKLALSSDTFRAGEVGYLRLKNVGTVTAYYSYRYRIWADGLEGKWEVPVDIGYISNDQPFVSPGLTGRCFQFRVPQLVEPGRYVVGIEATTGLLANPRILLGSFSVVE